MPTIQQLFDEKLGTIDPGKILKFRGEAWALSRGKKGPHHFHFKLTPLVAEPGNSMAWIEPDCVLINTITSATVVIEVCTSWQNFDSKRYLYNRKEVKSQLQLYYRVNTRTMERKRVPNNQWKLEKVIYVITDKKSKGKIKCNPAHDREYFIVCDSGDRWLNVPKARGMLSHILHSARGRNDLLVNWNENDPRIR
jgi:hypothetical protein